MRRSIPPDPVHQPLRRNGAVDIDQQGRQYASLAGMTQSNTLPVESNLDVAE